MARPFLEERASVEIDYGSSLGQSYAVSNTQTASGDSYGILHNPYPVLRYDLGYTNRRQAFTTEEMIDLFHRSGGTFGGFRLKDYTDLSTNNYVDTPTSTDQQCEAAAVADQYQIVRWYGTQGDTTQTRRRIRKPVSGSALVAIAGIDQAVGFAVDYTTGLIQFDDEQDVIVGITQAANAVVDFGAAHNYEVDDTVYFSGVVGMVEINGLRGKVVSLLGNTITVDIDSSLFTAYSSGGQTNSAPQAGEIVTAGCYFDIPVRFEADLSSASLNQYDTLSLNLNVVELLNP